MKASLHIRSIALEMKHVLLSNQRPRTNYRALSELEHAMKQLSHFCQYSTDKASKVFQLAQDYYCDQSAAANEALGQMLILIDQVEHAATMHEKWETERSQPFAEDAKTA